MIADGPPRNATPTAVDPSVTLGALVAERPARARLFERFRLEYCCGGRQTLAEACAKRGLHIDAVREALEALEATGVKPKGREDRDWRRTSIAELCAHIVLVHHQGLREAFPEIEALLSTVVRVHGASHPELSHLQRAFAGIRAELEPHLAAEEKELFPACLTAERHGGAIEESLLDRHEREHAVVGDALAALRVLGHDYDPGHALCNTHRALLDALATFELHLHEHIHEENNVLLPRMRELNASLNATAAQSSDSMDPPRDPSAARSRCRAAARRGSPSRPTPGALDREGDQGIPLSLFLQGGVCKVTGTLDAPFAIPPDDVLAQPTRASLFALLGELKRPVGTVELAKRLDLHPNGVRIHLERMQEAGLIERARDRRPRGRPRDAWTIAPGAQPGGGAPSGYRDLGRWLARAMRSRRGGLRGIEETGREIGREIAPAGAQAEADALKASLSALGFQPAVRLHKGERATICLGNCPYRDAVHENQPAICALHKGITRGLLDVLHPEAKLAGFVPHEPDQAGCLIELRGLGAPAK